MLNWIVMAGQCDAVRCFLRQHDMDGRCGTTLIARTPRSSCPAEQSELRTAAATHQAVRCSSYIEPSTIPTIYLHMQKA